VRNNDIDREPNKLCYELGNMFGATLSIAIRDRNGAILNPVEFVQSLDESGSPWKREDNGGAIKKVCARFIELCRRMGLLSRANLVTGYPSAADLSLAPFSRQHSDGAR